MPPRSTATGSGRGPAHGAASYRGTRRHRPPHKSDSASGSTRVVAEARPQRNVRTESRAKADARKQPHGSRLRKSSGHSGIGGEVRSQTAASALQAPGQHPTAPPTNTRQTPLRHPTDAPPAPDRHPASTRQTPLRHPTNTRQTPGKHPTDARPENDASVPATAETDAIRHDVPRVTPSQRAARGSHRCARQAPCRAYRARTYCPRQPRRPESCRGHWTPPRPARR